MNEFQIPQILNQISTTLQHCEKVTKGIYEGTYGHLLFIALYSKHGGTVDNRYLETSINNCIDDLSLMDRIDLCDGLVSVYWVLAQLQRWDFIDSDEIEFIHDSYPLLTKCAKEMAQNGNFDFLYGALGIGTFISLFEKDSLAESHLYEILIAIEAHMLRNATGMVESYDIKNGSIRSGMVDLGLAHGISSLIQFCLCTRKYKKCAVLATKIARSITDYLIEQSDMASRISYFGNNNLDDKTLNSRLGWCYGDLGIAFSIYQTGVSLGDENLTREAIKILDKTLSRRGVNETFHCDASLCHGTSGIAYIYYKMYRYTNNKTYQDAAIYWIGETVKYLHVDNEIIQSLHTSKTYQEENTGNGLLNGIAGIGLMLLSFITNDCSWDSCLILQDVTKQ